LSLLCSKFLIMLCCTAQEMFQSCSTIVPIMLKNCQLCWNYSASCSGIGKLTGLFF